MSDEIELDPPDYSAAYSDENFWEKCKKFLRKAGKTVLIPALTLKYCAEDPETPKHIKATIYGALGYFISPIDAIPDITPMIGFSDDLGVITMTVASVAMHIKPEHKERAREKVEKWL